MKTLRIDLNADGQNIKEYELHDGIDIQKLSRFNYDISKPIVIELKNGAVIIPPVIWGNSILTISES